MKGRSLIWVKKSRGPKTVPWGTPDLTRADSEELPINYYFLGSIGQKILNPIKSCSPNSIVVKFVQEVSTTGGDNIKGLTKIQDNNICLCLAFKILNKFISCNQKLAFA